MLGQPPTEPPPVGSSYDEKIDHEIHENSNGVPEPEMPHRSNTLEEKFLAERSLELLGSLKDDRLMTLWDVVTLNINSMIGTGIFTTPGLIFALTRSKTMTLTFWFAGGIYSLLGVYIYARYSEHMLFNGGEFLWLDAVFKRPKYLFAIIVAGFFLVLDTSAGNCLAFAKQIGLMHDPSTTRSEDLQRDTVTYLAVSVLTLVCFIHFFSPRVGRFLNRYFAWFKVAFLIAIIVAGIIAGFQKDSGRYETWGWHEGTKPDLLNVFSAMIFIIYGYSGWQTAFYVAGEIGLDDQPKKWDLELGSYIAVLCVSVLYLLTTLSYSLAIPFGSLVGAETLGSDLTVVLNFVPRAFHTGNTGWAKLFVAFSAFGYLISTIYASSRLNQKIFRQRFFPFYQLCDRDHPYYHTPTGGLIVHWFFTVLNIAIAPNTPGGYGFIINVKSYGHLALTLFLGIGIFFIRILRQTLGRPDKEEPASLRARGAGALLALSSAFFLVVSAMGQGYPAYWLWPVALVVVLAFFFIYWALFSLWVWRSSLANEGNRVEIWKYRPEYQSFVIDTPSISQERRTSYFSNLAPIRASSEMAREGGDAPENQSNQSESNEERQAREMREARIKEKLAYRWNLWGETRLIVYYWSNPMKKRLQKMYKQFGMPYETEKEIPHARRMRIANIASPDTLGGYSMAPAPRGSSPQGTPPGVYPSPHSFSAPFRAQSAPEPNPIPGGSRLPDSGY